MFTYRVCVYSSSGCDNAHVFWYLATENWILLIIVTHTSNYNLINISKTEFKKKFYQVFYQEQEFRLNNKNQFQPFCVLFAVVFLRFWKNYWKFRNVICYGPIWSDFGSKTSLDATFTSVFLPKKSALRQKKNKHRCKSASLRIWKSNKVFNKSGAPWVFLCI